MDEARRRGNREERVAQAVYRHQREEAKSLELRKERERAEYERIRNLSPEARKEILFRRASPKHTSLMLAVAAALAIPPTRKPR